VSLIRTVFKHRIQTCVCVHVLCRRAHPGDGGAGPGSRVHPGSHGYVQPVLSGAHDHPCAGNNNNTKLFIQYM